MLSFRRLLEMCELHILDRVDYRRDCYCNRGSQAILLNSQVALPVEKQHDLAEFLYGNRE
jgi:hypothetical protein